jgi:hypothetical protein
MEIQTMTSKSIFQSALAFGLLLGGVAVTRLALACPNCNGNLASTGAWYPLDGKTYYLYQNRAWVNGTTTEVYVNLINGGCATAIGETANHTSLVGCFAEDDTADGSSAYASGCSQAVTMWGGIGWCP